MSQILERIVFNETEKITAYEFINIKPLGKSPNGYLISVALAIALENGLIKVYDVYANLLFQIEVGKDIV